jgi:hypothetical protein
MAAMLPHTRAIVAAAAYAFMFREKVAGVHDHSEKRDLQIAAETRDEHLQAYDGDRSARFGGDLPELYDAGDEAFVSLAIDGMTAQGYDRNSSSHYSLTATDGMVQLYDHTPAAWFDFTIRVA